MPIILIDGNPNAGKSLWMNILVYKRYLRGEQPFLNWGVNYGEGFVERWNEFDEVLDVNSDDGKPRFIGVDEAYKIFDAHKWMSLPTSFSEKLAEHRHDGLVLYTATQNFGDLDLRVRNKVSTWFHVKEVFRFPFDQRVKPWIQLSVVHERKRAIIKEQDRWITVSKKRLWISRFFTKKLYDTYANLKLSKYICKLKIDTRKGKNIKKMIMATRDLVSRGRVRGF